MRIRTKQKKRKDWVDTISSQDKDGLDQLTRSEKSNFNLRDSVNMKNSFYQL